MTKVRFETATLADAFKKASIIAPGRGKAFDEAGGVVLEVMPDEKLVLIRATNGDIFHMEWVSALDVEGEAVKWRIPNQIAAPIISSLPIGTGQEIVLEEIRSGVSSHLLMTSGKTKAKFFMMDMSFYPEWEVFNPDDLHPVSDLGGRVAQVEWCAGKDNPPLNGVHFTGTEIKVTDRYRLAVVPLEIPNMPVPVTVPSGLLGQILKQTGDVQVGFTDHQMLLMPNPTTQLRVVIYGGEYPPMTRLMDRERPNKLIVKKSEFLAILNRAILAAPGDRQLLLHMYVGKETITVKVDGPETGVLDVMDVPGQADHARVDIRLTPNFLTQVLDHAPNDSITLHYDPSNEVRTLYIDGGSGYEVWVVARRE